MTDDLPGGAPDETGLTRQQFLRRGAAGAAALGFGSLASTAMGTAIAQAAPKPKVGGTLRVGLLGGGSSDTLDPQKLVSTPDFARLTNLYDPLTELAPNATSVTNCLAQEVVSDKTAGVWTIRLKKGIEWHNGKPLTADDVVFSLRRYCNPSFSGRRIDWMGPQNVKKIDAHTVQLHLPVPFVDVPTQLAGFDVAIIPVGFNPAKPVGTGPFVYQSFTPGQSSTFIRNKNYWREVYPDQLEIIDFSDPTSEQNALTSGQVDAIDAVPAAEIPIIKANRNLKLLISPTGAWRPFCMRVDVAPFNDPRVRQGMRLVVDRHQMLQNAFAGQGAIGNDLYSRFDSDYNHGLPQRAQDLEKAKSLFKAAGVSSVTLTTTEAVTGLNEASQILAQQAQGAGMTINLQNVAAGSFYGTNYLTYPFSVDYWDGSPFFSQVDKILRTNETHWGMQRAGGLSPQETQWVKLYKEARKTLNPGMRKELIHEIQKIEYDYGGYIIAEFVNIVNAFSARLYGLAPNKDGHGLNEFQFRLCYFA
jgi:peptide/nickel transport system substrate-binding protein